MATAKIRPASGSRFGDIYATDAHGRPIVLTFKGWELHTEYARSRARAAAALEHMGQHGTLLV